MAQRFVLFAVWALALIGLSAWSARFDYAAEAPAPTGAIVSPSCNEPQLYVFLHPHCPCSNVTVETLLRVRADHPQQWTLVFVLVVPKSCEPAWADGSLRRQLQEAKQEIRIDEGELSSRFQAKTSGECVWVEPNGIVVFRGGVTPKRGAAGPNPGLRWLEQRLQGDSPPPLSREVYGCPLGD
jgi:hypothetical protein